MKRLKPALLAFLALVTARKPRLESRVRNRRLAGPHEGARAVCPQTSSGWQQTEVRAAVFEPQAAQPENPRPAGSRGRAESVEWKPSEVNVIVDVYLYQSKNT